MKQKHLCKCGCNKPVFKRQNGKWNKFIAGHNLRIPLTKRKEQERRKKISNTMKQRLQNHPEEIEYRRICSTGRKHSKKSKQKMVIAAKKREEQKRKNGYIYPEEARKKISKAHKGRIKTKEHLRKIGLANKGKIITSKAKELTSKTLKKYYKTHKNPFKGHHHTEESLQKISKSKKGKYRGKKASNWQGGITSLPYSKEWTKWLRQEIKQRDKNKCQNPECTCQSTILGIHHIDYSKQNNNPRNLITLCKKCHGKTFHHNHKKYWKNYYQSLMNKKRKQGK